MESRSLYRAATIYIIMFAAVAAWAPFLQQYYMSLGIDLPLIGLLAAFTSATALVSAPIWGAIHDRIPNSRLLIPIAAVVGASGAVMMRFSGASPLLVVGAATWAIGMSGTSPMLDVRVLSLVGADRARYGWIRACGSASFIVFAPLVGLLVDARGLAAIFVIVVPSMLVAGFASVALPARPASVRTASLRKAPGAVLRHRPILLFLIGASVAWMAMSSQSAFFSIYLRDLGAPASMVGWTWAVAALLEVPVMFMFPWLARRFGLERLIVAGACFTVTRQIANVVFTAPALLLGCSIIQGVGYGLMLIGGVTFVSLQAPKGTAATAQGIFQGVTVNLAAIVGSGVGGQLAGLLGIRGLYAVSAGLGVGAVVLISLAVLPATRRGASTIGEVAVRADVTAEATDPAV
jgi:MFS transporter, PPP family, 3-phenylpropionic acid transporter